MITYLSGWPSFTDSCAHSHVKSMSLHDRIRDEQRKCRFNWERRFVWSPPTAPVEPATKGTMERLTRATKANVRWWDPRQLVVPRGLPTSLWHVSSHERASSIVPLEPTLPTSKGNQGALDSCHNNRCPTTEEPSQDRATCEVKEMRWGERPSTADNPQDGREGSHCVNSLRRELKNWEARSERTNLTNGADRSNVHKTGDAVGWRVPDRTSRRCVTSSALQPLGDRSRTRTAESHTGLESKVNGWSRFAHVASCDTMSQSLHYKQHMRKLASQGLSLDNKPSITTHQSLAKDACPKCGPENRPYRWNWIESAAHASTLPTQQRLNGGNHKSLRLGRHVEIEDSCFMFASLRPQPCTCKMQCKMWCKMWCHMWRKMWKM